MNSSYEQKHPLYAASFTKRRKAMDLYEGGERIEGNRAYLTRHTYESDKQYDIRANRATYRNFAAPIVDVFASFINEGRPERAIPDALCPIEADADRYGMTADAFFADVTRLAAAGGARFVIVDMEQKKGETVAEDRASGRRMDGAPRSLRRPAPLRNPDRLDAGLMDALPPPDEGQGEYRVRHCRGR